MVHRYYDLVTDFYEYGWGDNFHFYGQVNCPSLFVFYGKENLTTKG